MGKKKPKFHHRQTNRHSNISNNNAQSPREDKSPCDESINDEEDYTNFEENHGSLSDATECFDVTNLEFLDAIDKYLLGGHRFQPGGSPSTDPQDPRKYVVSRWDFSRIPRWPNDGIEQKKQAFASRGHHEESHNHHPLENTKDDPEFRALRDLFGWKTMPTSDMLRGFWIGLPFGLQTQAAKEQSDVSAAKDHLIRAYRRKDRGVRCLLKTLNCNKAIYKASCDPNRFPDFDAIIVPLFQQNLASDNNVRLLFGNVQRVRHFLLETGAKMAEPEDPLARASLARFGNGQKAVAKPKACAACGSTEAPSSELLFSKCPACQTVYYCSTACQNNHWKIHKPVCLRARGQAVPEPVLQTAESVRAKRERRARKAREAQIEARRQAHEQAVRAAETAFRDEPTGFGTWAHTCFQRPLPVHVPSPCARDLLTHLAFASAGLEAVEDLSPECHDGSGVLLREDSPGARQRHVLALYENLYAEHGDGACVGLHLHGLFVVASVSTHLCGSWRRVEAPFSGSTHANRSERLARYLQEALRQAPSLPDAVNLGINHTPWERLPTSSANPVVVRAKTPPATPSRMRWALVVVLIAVCWTRIAKNPSRSLDSLVELPPEPLGSLTRREPMGALLPGGVPLWVFSA